MCWRGVAFNLIAAHAGGFWTAPVLDWPRPAPSTPRGRAPHDSSRWPHVPEDIPEASKLHSQAKSTHLLVVGLGLAMWRARSVLFYPLGRSSASRAPAVTMEAPDSSVPDSVQSRTLRNEALAIFWMSRPNTIPMGAGLVALGAFGARTTMAPAGAGQLVAESGRLRPSGAAS